MRVLKFLKTVCAILILTGLITASFPQASAGESGIIDEANTIAEEWFDDALFIGDSQTGALAAYTLMNGGLGKALIYHVNGLACHHIVEGEKSYSFKGRDCSLTDVIALSGAKKLFLMLAMNDIGTRPIDELKNHWAEVIASIREQCPGVEIYIQSGTPVESDFGYLTRDNMEEYNKMLKEVCHDNNCWFVDVTRDLPDASGYLKEEYKKDNVHMNPDGCAIWVRNLKNPDSYIMVRSGE